MSDAVTPELLERYDGNLPRYTSYPTAVRFSDAVGSAEASRWLGELPVGEALSLYLHVPFCDELCGFCGCNTSVMRSESARSAYGDQLCEELTRVAGLIAAPKNRRPPVAHIHFGGGTPTTLPESAFRTIFRCLHALFDIQPDAEIGVELDPRHFTPSMARFLSELGCNRGSLGVQDLEPAVQQACGRIQTFEQTRACVESLRESGFTSINIDLIYGLPRQTTESVCATARQTAALKPDRLAVFGYAHVPWKLKRQQLMPEAELPGRDARIAQRNGIDRTLQEAGYLPVGLDHYVLPHDRMAQAARNGSLRRNFQGYTADDAAHLVGVGASAISSLPGGFTQNIVSAAAWGKALAESPGLPVARGVACTDDDRLRGRLIERLMCDLGVDLGAFAPEDFALERERLSRFVADGLVEMEGDRLRVTERGRPFIRNVAAVFDRYLAGQDAGPGRHSRAI
ncbi:coproporphyrinogen III oxidase [Acetobacter estunensis NRIC 0472]|uniref:Coproporphyrinogen-III oxidase n=1 Tax=Acetobacter estunensis TaxID=104097 RepID=A0A967EBM2_9PROT|nr:oxygen-independent coproporphyrinogen III oxidase [Acetobacter estunensis]NHO53633.1 oxygen-independent coproporphyrinogen III oxidase [Acetobacter estunensis]GBQ25074.1 coproporphyrinogen III oxidase [Acetobacter estunensis NRIC 0472]